MLTVTCSCGRDFQTAGVYLDVDFLCMDCRLIFGDYVSLTGPYVVTEWEPGPWLN